MMALVSAAFTLLPSLLLLWWFTRRDVYPEPARVVWATFGLGVLTIPFVLLLVWPLGPVVAMFSGPYLNGLASASLEAAIPEEALKLLVLLLYVARKRELDEPMDGLVYGVAVSLGFATLENVMYVVGNGLGTAILRAVTSVPGHAMTGAIMGFYFGQATFRRDERSKLLLLAFVVPTVLHALYDWPLMVIERLEGAQGRELEVLGLIFVTLGVLVLEWRVALRLARQLRAAQIAGAGDTTRIRLQLPPRAVETPAAGSSPWMPPPPPALADQPPGTTVTAPHLAVTAPHPLARPAPRRPVAFSCALAVALLSVAAALILGAGVMGLGLAFSAAERHAIDGMDIVVAVLVVLLPVGAGAWLGFLGMRRLARELDASSPPAVAAPPPGGALGR